MSPWLVLFVLTSRTVTVTGTETGPVHVRCPAGETTEIAFAEPLRQLKASADDRRRFGIEVLRTKPTGTLAVRPAAGAGTARLEFRGPSQVVELVLEEAPPSPPDPQPVPTPATRRSRPRANARRPRPTPAPAPGAVARRHARSRAISSGRRRS